jgi:hypothetical protein
MWLSLAVFMVFMYVFRALFRASKIASLGVALASGHLAFLLVFTVAMFFMVGWDRTYELVWTTVLFAIDLPVAACLRWVWPEWGTATSAVNVIWLPCLVFAVFGSLQYYLLGRFCARCFPLSPRRIFMLTIGVSFAYLLFMVILAAPFLGGDGLLPMIPTSLFAFGMEVYLFWLLLRSLNITRLGPAFALGHCSFILLFTLAMHIAVSRVRPVLDVSEVSYIVLRWIDLPATILFRHLGQFAERYILSPNSTGWGLYLIFLVLGSAQYYVLGTVGQRLYGRVNRGNR